MQVLFGMLWILLGPLVLRQRPDPEAELSDANDDPDPQKCLKIVGLVEHSWGGGVNL